MIRWPKPEPKKNKYNAKRTTVDGASFPSGLEASVYCLLKLREKSGEIKDIKRYASVYLMGRISWKVDFSCWDIANKRHLWVEAKGMECREYLLKKEIWRCGFGPGPLEIWKGTARKPVYIETIYPDKGNI